MCCSEPPLVVLRALSAMNHEFVSATNTKVDAFAKVHDLAREYQRKNGGEIQFGRTAHAIPPRRSIQECEFVAVDDDPMWVVIQA